MRQSIMKENNQPLGYLTLVLHAHLPYIRHHDRNDVMEERWFYEALIETYLPLIEVFDRLLQDEVDFRITMSMTPTLLSMCSDPLMQQRALRHIESLIELAEKETIRLRKDVPFLPLAQMYAQRFRKFKHLYQACNYNIVEKFKQYQQQGFIEIITSAATHAYLPLMKTEEAIRAQIATAVTDYEHYFDQSPRGIWLPECGYTPGIDRILKSYGIQYFFVDSTAIKFAKPQANRGLVAPLMTPYGTMAFPRDPHSSEQVWSSEDGYPGDYNYREYYRDIGWDLGWESRQEWEYIKPYVLPTYERVNTGIKYYRITGKEKYREPYNPTKAKEKAAEHAGNFMFNREQQAKHWNHWLDRKPIIVTPYDAELFGHWWFEGPLWIEFLCRKIYFDQTTIQMITPSEYLEAYPEADVGKINESSWGRSHSSEVWLQGNNHWIYRHLHHAEERMIRLATHYQHLDNKAKNAQIINSALNQAARELMLAQSSDWAFIMDAQTVVPYAIQRTKDHLGCFHQLCDLIERNQIDRSYVQTLEEKDNCFPFINYRDYISKATPSPFSSVMDGDTWEKLKLETQHKQNIFMLAWEYPPKYVGGLSRAVSDLSESLADQGEIVHIITTYHEGSPSFEQKNGVFIHRLPILSSGDTDFYHWTFEMNMAMTHYLVRWKENGGRIDLLHAHDWMVYHVARELKQSYTIPLVVTIHATEWGRNQGKLYTDISKRIHHFEWNLTYEAYRVFVCSQAMKIEVQGIFQLPGDKIHIVPNGTMLPDHLKNDYPAPNTSKESKIIFYIGRLVFEKGVHVLIHAMPTILSQIPNCRLIIAGSGPMEEELRQLAKALSLTDHISFIGYVDEENKNKFFQEADVCVFPSLYEPFGIVALEAMKYRKPLVVSDTGGFAEIIQHGKDGYKALPGHVESLAWHVTELFLQPKHAEKMAEAAFHKVEQKYQWSQIAKQVKQIYDDMNSFSKLNIEEPDGDSTPPDSEPTYRGGGLNPIK